MDYQDPPSFQDPAQDTGSRPLSGRVNDRYRASHQRSSGNQDQGQDSFPGRPPAQDRSQGDFWSRPAPSPDRSPGRNQAADRSPGRYPDQERHQDQRGYPDQERYQDPGRYPDQERHQDQGRYLDPSRYQDQGRSEGDPWVRSAASQDRYQAGQAVLDHPAYPERRGTDWDAPQDPAWSKLAPGRPPPSPDGPRRGARGRLVGAVTGVLAAANALGIAMLVSAFIRPQASPIIAVGGQAINLTPTPLKEFAVAHFGEDDKTMLLAGMYVVIAGIAMVIGWLGRRKLLVGVIGIGAFGVFGAIVALIQPGSHTTDAIPALVGGVAGVAAIITLVKGSRPAAFSSVGGHTRDLA